MRLHRSLLGAAFLLVIAFAQGQTTPTKSPPAQTNPFLTGPEKRASETLSKEDKEEVLKALADVIANRAFVPGVDLSKWQEYIDKEKEDIDKAESDGALARAVNNALKDFGVSHIRLLTPRAAETRSRTSIVSIGVTSRVENKTLVITSVMPQSPAEAQGIKVGDVITSVDGKAPENQQVLGGDEGSEVKLKVKSGDVEKDFTVKRARVSTARPETLVWANDDTAVLRIWTFSRGYSRDNIEALMKQVNGKAKNLIVDLRSNGGGSVANLQHLLSLLLPPDTVIGTFVGKDTVKEYEKEHTPTTDPVQIAKDATDRYKTRKLEMTPFKGKVAVLINRGSASASEIFTAAMREVSGSPVVGSASMGAVLASIFRPLPQGFQIQYPVSDYVTIKGNRLEANPIKPDAEAAGAGQDGKDAAVEKAIELLKSK